jgi:hypothetical protein
LSFDEYNKGRKKSLYNTGPPTNVWQVIGHQAGEQQKQAQELPARQHGGNNHAASGDKFPEWLSTVTRYTFPIGGVAGLILGAWFFSLSWLVLVCGFGGAVIGLIAPVVLYGAFFLLAGITILLIVAAVLFAIAKLVFQL